VNVVQAAEDGPPADRPGDSGRLSRVLFGVWFGVYSGVLRPRAGALYEMETPLNSPSVVVYSTPT
jgi:hypothetical protein